MMQLMMGQPPPAGWKSVTANLELTGGLTATEALAEPLLRQEVEHLTADELEALCRMLASGFHLVEALRRIQAAKAGRCARACVCCVVQCVCVRVRVCV